MNPGWLKKAHAKQEAAFERLNAARPTYAIPKRLGWTYKGVKISAFPAPGYDWNPKVIQAIQRIDPDLQPLWITYIYLSPPEDGRDNVQVHTFGRNALGRVNRDPHSQLYSLPVEMPSRTSYSYWSFKMQKPNMIEHIFVGDRDSRAADLPGAYQPLDWEAYYFLASAYGHHTLAALRSKWMSEDAYEAQLEKTQEEEAYKVSQVTKFAQKKLEQTSEVELKEYMLGGGFEASAPKPTVAIPEAPAVSSQVSTEGSTPSGA